MSSGFRAALGISGWLVTAALISLYLLDTYEAIVVSTSSSWSSSRAGWVSSGARKTLCSGVPLR